MTISIPEQLKTAFPARAPDMHKYAAGAVFAAGGSERFPNAPAIAALGARAAGAGLVRLWAPEPSRLSAAVLVPEATFAAGAGGEDFSRADAVVAGMGLDARAKETVAQILSSTARRVVFDADALSALAAAECGGLSSGGDGFREAIVTPHSGEAARMLGCGAKDVDADRDGAAEALRSKFGATVVLKGRRTIVLSRDGADSFVCGAGNPFMAAGGSGDLLAGAIAARFARLARAGTVQNQTRAAFLAAASAVWLHAAAADSLVAQDMPCEPCAANLAARMASIRIILERSPE